MALWKHNVHLVTKGFTQVEGFDFNKKISPITRMESIEVVFVVVAIEDFWVHQLDVKITFLNEHLLEDIYICNNQRALWSRVRRIWYVNFKNLCMVWNNIFMNGTIRLMHISYFKHLKGAMLTIMFILRELKKILIDINFVC